MLVLVLANNYLLLFVGWVGFGAGQAWVLHCYRCGAEASTTSGKDWHKL